jgi:hypothetical protein
MVGYLAGIFMRAFMGVLQDRHGTYYARVKVRPDLREAVARVLDNGKGSVMTTTKIRRIQRISNSR